MNIRKIRTIFTGILAATIIGGVPISADGIVTGEYYYNNTDSAEVKNTKLTKDEKQEAKEERMTPEADLGYKHDMIIICYERKKAVSNAQALGLNSEWDLYQKDLIDHGDDSFSTLDAFILDETVLFYVDLNDNKTVKTAVEEYSQLDRIIEAKPEPYTPSTSIPASLKLQDITPIYNDDSVTFNCIAKNACENTTYRWEYCKIGSDEWRLLSDWNTSNQCTWYPDANEEYAIVCRASYNGNETIDSEIVWYASRPQMNKRITGRCALPTEDGILFGCTSTVGKEDKDYLTTCYIWSFEQQAWITKAAYEASNCAWYKASGLPKGNYIMYNCTEKKMPDGTLRKLSCDYYHFAI